MAPFSWNGSEFIYKRFLQPWVIKHEAKIDQYLDKAKERASRLYDDGMAWCITIVNCTLVKFLNFYLID